MTNKMRPRELRCLKNLYKLTKLTLPFHGVCLKWQRVETNELSLRIEAKERKKEGKKKDSESDNQVRRSEE